MIPAPAGGSRRAGLALVAVAQLVVFGISFHGFLSSSNLTTIAQNSTDILIASIGTAALVISGNVDLSIGSQYALVSVVTAETALHAPPWVAALAALGTGLAAGALNGLLVVGLSISPLIVTLAMLALYRGLAFEISQGDPVGLTGRTGFTDLGTSHLLGLPTPVVVALLTFAAGAWILMTTVTGLRLFAVGADRDAAAKVGLPVRRTIVGTYAANGLLVGLVGLLVTAQLGSGNANVGVDFEVAVLTAVILGGVAFTGGVGSPVGVFVGVATLGILDAGLIFDGLADWWQQITRGSLLLLALSADQLVLRLRARRVPPVERVPDVAARVEAVRPPEREVTGGRLLELAGVSAGFGSTRVLEDVDLVVDAGEVVCLVGDNGAGKSTLVKAITGVVHPSEGAITLAGQPLPTTPAAVRRAGIETVFQDLALFGNLTVADNIGIGLEARRRLAGALVVRDHRRARSRATERLAALGSPLGPDRVVGELSGGQRQAVAIARALRDDVRLVVLDEPTAALGARQSAEVLGLVRRTAGAGRGVLLITHDVEDVFEVADRVVVLGRGRVIADVAIGELDRLELVRLMSAR